MKTVFPLNVRSLAQMPQVTNAPCIVSITIEVESKNKGYTAAVDVSRYSDDPPVELVSLDLLIMAARNAIRDLYPDSKLLSEIE